MSIRIVLLFLCFSVPTLRTCAAFQSTKPAETTAGSKDQKESENHLWLIPHTHWEGAVFKTREEYLEEDLPNILQALHLLRIFPEYRFVLDQVAYVKPFLDRYPEQAAEFRKLIDEGKLQIVGGNDVMLDVNIPRESRGSGRCYREGVLQEDTQRGCDHGLGAGHLRPPRPDAPTAQISRL